MLITYYHKFTTLKQQPVLSHRLHGPGVWEQQDSLLRFSQGWIKASSGLCSYLELRALVHIHSCCHEIQCLAAGGLRSLFPAWLLPGGVLSGVLEYRMSCFLALPPSKPAVQYLPFVESFSDFKSLGLSLSLTSRSRYRGPCD